MKKKLLILLAVAAMIATVIAAPAGAFGRQSLRGYQDLDFNFGIVTGEGGGAAQGVAYVGTLELRGGTYDIVYYSLGPPVPHGDWTYFEERVVIYAPDTLHVKWDNIEFPPGESIVDGLLSEFDDSGGVPVVEFTDKGWVSPRGTGFAWGKVITTNDDPGGVLDNVAEGDRTFWYGRYLDDLHTRFAGPFRIFTRG